MSWLIIAVTAVHVIVCLILILVVLLQSGKAADLAGAFGGMGSQTVFGPRGTATVLSKATTIAAALFMITSLSLGILANGQTRASNSIWKIGPRRHLRSKRKPCRCQYRHSLLLLLPRPRLPQQSKERVLFKLRMTELADALA